MLISIIIPIYNAAQYLEKCIKSILNQVNANFELILINDGSTDNSLSICEKYAKIDKRIQIFNQINQGVSSARNLGIQHSKGEWITFIDADDYIEQNYILSEIPQSSTLIIQNWKELQTGNVKEYLFQQHINKDLIRNFLNNNIHKDIIRCPWGKFYNREIIKKHKILFNEKFKIGEDTLFVLNYLYYCDTIDIIATSFYIYRTCTNTSKYKQTIDKTLEYIDHFWSIYSKLSCDNKQILSLLYGYYYNLTLNIDKPNILKKWISHKSIIEILNRLYYSHGIKNRLIYYKLKINSIIYRMMNLN